MRLERAENKRAANAVIKKFIPQHNRRFTVVPVNPDPAWRPIPKGIDLLQILCVKEQRTVANDNTVSYNGFTLQIPKSKIRSSFAKAKVDVHHLINGEVHVFYNNERIAQFSSETIQLKDRRQA